MLLLQGLKIPATPGDGLTSLGTGIYRRGRSHLPNIMRIISRETFSHERVLHGPWSSSKFWEDNVIHNCRPEIAMDLRLAGVHGFRAIKFRHQTSHIHFNLGPTLEVQSVC
jgi:hypothetical protein